MPFGEKIKIYYDALGRAVRTVNPDNSEQRVVLGIPKALDTPKSYTPTPWESYTYDAEDLDEESDHFATPKSAEVDALGRSVKTMDRLVSNDVAGDNVRMLYKYDIRGNLLEVTDALNRKIFDYTYDLRPPAKEGESIPPLKTVHIDKGTSTVVFDCMGKPLQGDDAKGARTLNACDELMRPTDAWARDVTGEDITLRQHLVYGDSAGLTDPQDENLKGKLYEQYDEAGYQRMDSYDFKGNLLHKYRQVISDTALLSVFDGPPTDWDVHCYRVDWTGFPSILASKEYHTNMSYDALNRIMTLEYPEDTSTARKVLTPTYNKAGALNSVTLDSVEYVKEIAYNAKGQRLLIALGNGWMTRYTYDPLTFRLQRLKTEQYTYSATGTESTYEPQSGSTRQDFAYTYDKVGNILSINNETPDCGAGGTDTLLREFDYDALYRLLSGTGRENQPTTAFPGWDDTTRSDDANATESYTQNYSYDRMGNFSQFQHVAYNSSNSFTRTFNYISGTNRIDKIEIGSNVYQFNYDNNGNLTTENTERHFEWDHSDQMRCFYNQTGTSEPTVYTQYLYAGGTRIKKITRKSSGDKYITVYIDGIFEHSYHLDGSNAMDEELNELHVMDDQTRVAMLRTGYDDGTPFTKYILSDHLGSSNVILETSGAVYNREEFYPFGETSFGAFGKKRYRYVGKEKDEESGLYYYGARYFQPWSCRFISVDPLAGKYAQLTPYNYADNTPVTDKDIDGKQTQSSDISAKSNTTSSTPTAQSTPTLIINTNQIKVLETKTAVVNYLYSQIKQGVFNLVPCPAPNMSEMEIKKTLNTLVNVDSKNPNVAFVILSDEKIFQIQVQQGVETVKDETKDYIKDKAIDKTKDLVTKAIVKSTLNYRFDTKTVAKEELIKSFGAERALKAINISSKIFKTLSVAMKEIGRFKVEAFYKVLSSGTPEYSHERFEMAVLTVLNQWAIEQSTKNQPADYKSLKLPFVPMQQDEYLRAPK